MHGEVHKRYKAGEHSVHAASSWLCCGTGVKACHDDDARKARIVSLLDSPSHSWHWPCTAMYKQGKGHNWRLGVRHNPPPREMELSLLAGAHWCDRGKNTGTTELLLTLTEVWLWNLICYVMTYFRFINCTSFCINAQFFYSYLSAFSV